MIIHPLLVFLTSVMTVQLTAAFTDHGSPLRYAALLPLMALAYLLPLSLSAFSDCRGWIGRISTGATFWNIVTLFDRLIRRGWDYESYTKRTRDFEKSRNGEREVDESKTAAKTRMEVGADISGLARGIDTFWEVKNVPRFSETDPEYVPERFPFLLRHALTAVACYYAHNWAAMKMLSADRSLMDSAYVPILTRLSDITRDELQTRSMVSGAYWLAQFCNMQFFYSLVATVTALTNPRDIRLFRPLFGSPLDAYTVRNAWGKSWHQSLRSGIEGISAFLAHDVLRLPCKGFLQRYSKIFFGFALSGIMHVAADTGGGLSWTESGALQFFCVQALGIVLEDAAQAVYFDALGASRSTLASIFAQVVGYIWVGGFVIWSSPVWIYPAILAMREEDAILGLAAFKAFLFGRAPKVL